MVTPYISITAIAGSIMGRLTGVQVEELLKDQSDRFSRVALEVTLVLCKMEEEDLYATYRGLAAGGAKVIFVYDSNGELIRFDSTDLVDMTTL